MSVLDTAPLNTQLLGSKGAVSAYGGNVVKFSGRITQALSGTLGVGSLARHVRIVRPMLLNCWLGARPIKKVNGSLFAGQAMNTSFSPRVRTLASPDQPAVMVLDGQINPSVRAIFRLRVTQPMVLVCSNAGTDLSTTPAPSERSCYVPAIERSAFVLRN